MRWVFRIFKWMGLGLSTVLLVATGVLWVRSVGYQERWHFVHYETHWNWATGPLEGQGRKRSSVLELKYGRLWIAFDAVAPIRNQKAEVFYQRTKLPRVTERTYFEFVFPPGEHEWVGGTQSVWRFAGLGFRHQRANIIPNTGLPLIEGIMLAIPFWMLTLLFALWPGLFVLCRLLRKKPYAAGMCPDCGYDLRATPDPTGPRLPRCPECGREVVPEAL